MLPRRTSADLIPGRTPSQQISGTVRGRRPLSMVTTQQIFHASPAETVDIEYEPETSPSEPHPLPRPAPDESKHRPQLTQRAAHDTKTFPSTLEEPPYMPFPTVPVIQISQPPSPTPTTRPRLAPGDDMDGLPHRPTSRGSSAYNYRFDAVPPSPSDAGPPEWTANICDGIHADVWPTYNKISQEYDEKRLAKWSTDLDVLLIFVRLRGWLVINFDRANTFRRPPCSLP